MALLTGIGRNATSATVDRAEEELLSGMFGGFFRHGSSVQNRTDGDLAYALDEALGDHEALVSGRVWAGVDDHWLTLAGLATDGEWRELERRALSVQGAAGIRLRHANSRPPANGRA